MTEAEKQIIEILKAQRVIAPQAQNLMSEHLMKAAMTIVIAGIIWIITSVSDLKNTMTEIKTKQISSEQEIKDLKSFASRPSFTIEDFHINMQAHKERLQAVAEKIIKLENNLDEKK